MDLEGLWFLGGLAAAAAAVVSLRPFNRRVAGLTAAVVAGTLLGAGAWQRSTARKALSREQLTAANPTQGRPGGYLSSETCRSCHPEAYATWHHSYHRTMTQEASPTSVVANFRSVQLELNGEIYRLEQEGDEYWVDLPGSAAPAGAGDGPAGRMRRRVGLLTGSHHMQVFWYAAGSGNGQSVFPFAWLIGDARWVPFHRTFLRDPAIPEAKQTWNANCIQCHVTGGQTIPVATSRTFATRVGELGIACEACHGPGEYHVTEQQNPWKRYAEHFREAPDSTITHPGRLGAHRSAQVCGQCHSIKWIKDRADQLQHGFRYLPGQELSATTPVVRPTRLADQPWLTAPLKQAPTFLRDHFWPDGMVRVSGREYNGLLESPCHQRGELSCLSCHSMHRSISRDDQLGVGMDGNAACTSCHPKIGERLAEHTHHRPGSSGSLCYNCHMPHTTYGLLKAIRSHQIDSPTVASSLQTGRPNACNLCHLDQTLAWTAQHLHTWFGQKVPTLTEDQKTVAAAVDWTLRGDAGQRALLAWSMGWTAAQEASGTEWMEPYLAALLEDPYSAVRYIAHRSLKTLDGAETVPSYDFVGAPATWAAARTNVMARWQNRVRSVDAEKGTRVLLDATGTLRDETFRAWSRQRDDRSIDLQE